MTDENSIRMLGTEDRRDMDKRRLATEVYWKGDKNPQMQDQSPKE